MRHHAPGAARHFGVEDVVLLDEETRAGGQWGTTSPGPVGILERRTWCLRTKEQGIAGNEAPRPGAVRHVGAEDVVLLDEEIRAGEG